jgi:DNA-binding NarL/FixJ family response regulator
MTNALIEVSQGKKYICEEIRNLIAERLLEDNDTEKSLQALSIREIEIIKLVKEGMSSKEIATAASISVKTVEVHRYNILKKLQLKNAAALVNFVHEHDFIFG